jgi:hypothetical protein
MVAGARNVWRVVREGVTPKNRNVFLLNGCMCERER